LLEAASSEPQNLATGTENAPIIIRALANMEKSQVKFVDPLEA
jgi:hypothetical protein